MPLLPLTLAAGNQLNVTAEFFARPRQAWPTGSLQIAYAGGTYAASLAGNAVVSFFSYQITKDGTTSPLTVGQTITLDNTTVGSTSSAVIQFQNAGTTAQTITTLGTSGAAFSITSGPIVPLTVQPGQSNSLTVTYTPTLSQDHLTGQLLIGNDSFPLLRPTVAPLLAVFLSGGHLYDPSQSRGRNLVFPPSRSDKQESIQFNVTNAPGFERSSLGQHRRRAAPTASSTLASLPALPLQAADPNAPLRALTSASRRKPPVSRRPRL